MYLVKPHSQTFVFGYAKTNSAGFTAFKWKRACTLIATGWLFGFIRVGLFFHLLFILSVVLQCEVCCHGAEERDNVAAAVHSPANEEERHGVSKHQDRR